MQLNKTVAAIGVLTVATLGIGAIFFPPLIIPAKLALTASIGLLTNLLTSSECNVTIEGDSPLEDPSQIVRPPNPMAQNIEHQPGMHFRYHRHIGNGELTIDADYHNQINGHPRPQNS